ncbi:MAG: CvpA family protein [Treponema sp.]|nr:CvpA family protein [Treponema sp.]
MIFDLVFITIIFLCILLCTIKGFINVVFGIGAPVVSFWIAAIFYGWLSESLSVFISNNFACIVISYILIFIIAFLFLKIIQHVVRKIFDNDIFNSLDRVLGFVFGIFAGLSLVIFIIVVLLVIPDIGLNDKVKESISFNFLSKLITFPTLNIFGK